MKHKNVLNLLKCSSPLPYYFTEIALVEITCDVLSPFTLHSYLS